MKVQSLVTFNQLEPIQSDLKLPCEDSLCLFDWILHHFLTYWLYHCWDEATVQKQDHQVTRQTV